MKEIIILLAIMTMMGLGLIVFGPQARFASLGMLCLGMVPFGLIGAIAAYKESKKNGTK